MASEFELIRRFFQRPSRHTDLAVGDDAALMRVGEHMQLAVSSDMLVAGTHFLPDTDPRALGWKALAVNISDLAAMGAQARWVTLALSLPTAEETWLAAFAGGFLDACDTFGVDLVGGDTTRGPLNLCPTIFGEVPCGAAITRAGAAPGDDLWISGQPGRAALALAHLRGSLVLDEASRDDFLDALHRPQPRAALGIALRGIASAMLDVSDGLLGDLGHLLDASGVGAELEFNALPLAPLRAAGVGAQAALAALLGGGDDYELLFTAAPSQRSALAALAATCALPLRCIGTMTTARGAITLHSGEGRRQTLERLGYDHFSVTHGQPP